MAKLTPKSIIIILFVLLAVGAGAGGVYLADRLYLEPMREQRQMIDNLKTLVERLSKESRVAEVAVTEQMENPLRTTFTFVEVDERHEPLGEARSFVIDGDVAYFDTLVIKFKPEFLPLNDARLKSREVSDLLPKKAVILFRRVFSEKQKPEDGFALDMPGEPPRPYRETVDLRALETKLWNEFWQLANDPKLAEARGVHAAHGIAPYTRLVKNKFYVLERTLSGDLTIRPVDVPAVLRKP